MKLEHIILAGDSAGGHLSTSVAMLAILRGFRKPDSIFAHYPVLFADFKAFPSLLLTIDEWLLSETFMSCVFGCFMRNGGNPKINPILSPFVAPDTLLNHLPRMYMTCCQADPLRDQSVGFLERLLKADYGTTPRRCKLFYMKEYVHGHCSFDFKMGVTEYAKATKIIIEGFKELFEFAENPNDPRLKTDVHPSKAD